MPRPLQQYLNGYYERVIEHEKLPDGRKVFTARLACLPRCLAQADSETEAIMLLDENRRRMFQERAERRVSLPEPDVVINPEVTTSGSAFVPTVLSYGDVQTATKDVVEEGYAFP